MRRMDAKRRGFALAGLIVCQLLTAPVESSEPETMAVSTSVVPARRVETGDLSEAARENAAELALATRLSAVRRQTVDDGAARSQSFCVTAPSGDFLAERVLRAAEQCRREIALTWFGEPLDDGIGFAFIHVELCKEQDVGLAMIDSRNQRDHRIWLQTSADRALGTTLAHEIAHVVLSTRFSDDMPVWATEGVACRYDDPGRAAVRAEIVARFVRSGRWPSIGVLLQAPAIEPTDETSYAAAVSLTDFLLSLGGPDVFLDFVESGQACGWESALRQHYGIASIDVLSDRWRGWVTANQPQTRQPSRWTAISTRTESAPTR